MWYGNWSCIYGSGFLNFNLWFSGFSYWVTVTPDNQRRNLSKIKYFICFYIFIINYWNSQLFSEISEYADLSSAQPLLSVIINDSSNGKLSAGDNGLFVVSIHCIFIFLKEDFISLYKFRINELFNSSECLVHVCFSSLLNGIMESALS